MGTHFSSDGGARGHRKQIPEKKKIYQTARDALKTLGKREGFKPGGEKE